MAQEIGYPVIIKATAGGGGRGMRLVENKANLEKMFKAAQGEAEAAFGNDGLYMENLNCRSELFRHFLLVPTTSKRFCDSDVGVAVGNDDSVGLDESLLEGSKDGVDDGSNDGFPFIRPNSDSKCVTID
jgi:hypothetical protein